jgi:asparagine synthase (glutamine-hydrolysing)
MCGIAALLNWGDPDALERMAAVQRHRGPDDGGTWSSRFPGGWVGLASRRLAILDLSPAGHMPMASSDGNLQIVYNGEIYNFPQLRGFLESQGCRLRTRSDTEVILHLYDRYGEDCVTHLNGIFAFAIWDAKRNQLFFARDHFGIKPLYYIQQGDRLALASEVKALLELPDVERRVDPFALQQYLTFLWVPDPLTMFRGIAKLPPGHLAVFRDGRLTTRRYWDLTFPEAGHRFERNPSELAIELRERFIDVVQSQMLSDVPLGAFLSGGLDSSSIVAAMHERTTEPVRTFTIAFPAEQRKGEITLDDTAVARRTAARFGCDHTEIVVEPDVVDLLPKLIWHMDEPTADPAIITAYLVNRAARPFVTVLLSGVGGDEIFGGYRKYRAHYLAQRYQRLPAFLRRGLIEPLLHSLPSFRGTPLKGYVRLAKKMARSGSLPPRERFITDSVYLDRAQRSGLLASPVDVNGGVDISHRRQFERVAGADFLNQMMYVDVKTFLVSLNLMYNDKMSMASSIEARVPFLDWKLAEWVAWNVPPEQKLEGNVTKSILRKAMGPLLPDEVLTAKKAGFGAPVDHWLAHDLRPMTDDLLSESAIRRRGYFRPEAVRQMIDAHRSGRTDWSYQIWELLTFELWMQAFIDGKAV